MKINLNSEREKLHAHLKALGVFEEIDKNQIEIYLVNLKSYWDYEEYFKDHDRTIVTLSEGGDVRYAQQVPEVNFQKENWNVIQKLSSEFGLTPKARVSIKAEKSKVESNPVQLLRNKHSVRVFKGN
jgi:P27 family predicted phage terminase small subunit